MTFYDYDGYKSWWGGYDIILLFPYNVCFWCMGNVWILRDGNDSLSLYHLVQTEISQQLLNGLLLNFVQTLMVPGGWILMTFPVMPPWGWPLRFEWNISTTVAMEVATHIQIPPQDEL